MKCIHIKNGKVTNISHAGAELDNDWKELELPNHDMLMLVDDDFWVEIGDILAEDGHFDRGSLSQEAPQRNKPNNPIIHKNV